MSDDAARNYSSDVHFGHHFADMAAGCHNRPGSDRVGSNRSHNDSIDYS